MNIRQKTSRLSAQPKRSARPAGVFGAPGVAARKNVALTISQKQNDTATDDMCCELRSHIVDF